MAGLTGLRFELPIRGVWQQLSQRQTIFGRLLFLRLGPCRVGRCVIRNADDYVLEIFGGADYNSEAKASATVLSGLLIAFLFHSHDHLSLSVSGVRKVGLTNLRHLCPPPTAHRLLLTAHCLLPICCLFPPVLL